MGNEVLKPKVVLFYATEQEGFRIVFPVLKRLRADVRDHVLVINTGVGKVCATNAATLVLEKLKNNFASLDGIEFINVGVVGGNDVAFRESPVGFVGKVFNNDFDTSVVDGLPFDKPFINLSNEDGLVSCFTQDHFVTNLSDVQASVGVNFTEKFYVDMELYALAYVLSTSNLHLTSIKAISDIVESGYQSEQYFGLGFDNASKLASDKLYEFLENKLCGGVQ